MERKENSILEPTPIKMYTAEFVDELCLENIHGVVINFFTHAEIVQKPLAWNRESVGLVNVHSFGFYGVNNVKERFTAKTPHYNVVYHILAPVLNPGYSTRNFDGKDVLRGMARKYLEDIENSGEDMFEFVLKDIYNLYIYYFSIGTYPVTDIFADFITYLKFKDIDLPMLSAERYFDTLFSYFKVYAFKVEDVEDLKKALELSQNLVVANRPEKGVHLD